MSNEKFRTLKLLGFTLNGTPSPWIETHKKRFKGLTNYTDDLAQQYIRVSDLHETLCLFSFEHFGFDTQLDREGFLEQSVNVFKDYFLGEWRIKQAEFDSRLRKSSSAMKWYEALQKGMLVAMLAGDWDSIRSVAEWFEKKPKPDFSCDDEAPDLSDFYLHIISHYKRSPLRLPSINKLLAATKEPRTKLLLNCWHAIESNDIEQYRECIVSAVNAFTKKPGRKHHILEWIAIPESILCSIAESKGWEPIRENAVNSVLLRSNDWT